MIKNIRAITFILAAVLALGAWVYCIVLYPAGAIRDIPLEEFYAFLSLIFLYLALLATPLYNAVPSAPGKAIYMRARRALGVSAFGFALLHGAIAFFGLFEGFKGLPFLGHSYHIALFWGTVGLIILFLLAAVSFDCAVTFMGPWWKRLQRLAYVAGIATLIHVVIIGSHYSDLSLIIPTISFTLIVMLLVLESIRFDDFIRMRYMQESRSFGFTFVVLFALLVLFSYMYVVQAGPGGVGGFSLNIHAQHERQNAK